MFHDVIEISARARSNLTSSAIRYAFRLSSASLGLVKGFRSTVGLLNRLGRDPGPAAGFAALPPARLFYHASITPPSRSLPGDAPESVIAGHSCEGRRHEYWTSCRTTRRPGAAGETPRAAGAVPG